MGYFGGKLNQQTVIKTHLNLQIANYLGTIKVALIYNVASWCLECIMSRAYIQFACYY